MKVHRQGDVFVKYKSVPAEVLEKIPARGKDETVARGSTTNHTHVISKARLVKVAEGVYQGKLGKGATIRTVQPDGTEPRHRTLELPPGEVEVFCQLEDDGGEAARLAAD